MMRRGIVWLALAGTLFACWWVGNEEPAELADSLDSAVDVKKTSPVRARQVKPSVTDSHITPSVTHSHVTPSVTLEQAMPGLASVLPVESTSVTPVIVPVAVTEPEAGVNLFAALELPSAANAVEVPAPINPYTYAGRLQEAGRWTIFLTDGQQQYVLHEGDHFAEGWQVAVLDEQKVVLRHAAERFEIRLDNGVVF